MTRIDGIASDLKEAIDDFAYEFKLISRIQEELETRLRKLEEISDQKIKFK